MLDQVTLALMLVAAAAGAARGFSGFGAALIFVPLASALAGPRLAAPVLLLIDMVMALPLIPAALPHVKTREVGLLAAGALAGTPLGTLALLHLDALALRWIICALAAAMLALPISGWRYRGEPRAAATIGVGGLSGLGSGIAQIGGPPVVAYLLGGNREAMAMRATIIVYFALMNAVSGAIYLWNGLIGWPALTLAALVGPAYGAGLWAGARVFHLASPDHFRRICLALIALSVALSTPWRSLF